MTAAYLINNKEIKKTSSSTTPANVINPKVSEPKAIIEFLKDKKLGIIGDEENTVWASKWEAFKKEYQSKKPPEGWIMEGWENKKSESSTPTEFKTLCKNNGNKKINDVSDSNLTMTETYCTKRAET